MTAPHQQQEQPHQQINVINNTKNPVLTVQDEEDFSLVQFRPLTYAEVASIASPSENEPTRIYVTSDEVNLDDSFSSSYYDTDDGNDQSSESAHSTIGMRIQSEFLYGDRGREFMRKHQRWGINGTHGGQMYLLGHSKA